MEKKGFEYITGLIRDAVQSGRHQAVVTGDWEISRAIRLPSCFTLILEDCHLTMADGVYENMFINASCRIDNNARDFDIHIIGRGRAVLDGGNYNGLSERNCLKDGLPHISYNNLILFTNVRGFSVSGLKLINQRWWAMNFLYCSHGHLSCLEFCSNHDAVSPSGEHLDYFSEENYEGIVVKNSDGIDLRCGCHDILIENITGFTEDDTVALTALPGKLEAMYRPDGGEDEIRDVIIRNVSAAAFCAVVRILNQGGTRIRNILVDGIMDTSRDCPYIHGQVSTVVRVGDPHPYGSRPSEPGETKNILIRNVFTSKRYGVLLDGCLTSCRVENVFTDEASEQAVLIRGEMID